MGDNLRTRLTSLERLERQLQAITPDRAQGDAWEKALKGWINAGGHPELTKAWMWGEWPGKLKAGLKGDKGVDLVAETRDKQLVAIQVKFRRDPNDPVTAPEVQKLVGSYRKHFTLFALASNAWSATRGVSEAVGDEDAMLILREQLLESNYDWAAKKSIKRTKFTPFPFQKVAAENVRKALAKGGRAQIVMACGTGKTVTMLLAAEALDAQRVLVLAPTLLLVKQLRDEWVSKRRPDREWASLAVCSDIGDGVDASEIAPAEFGAPPTTNPDDIAAFLKKPGRRVVFGTYASSDRIAKAQKKAGVPSFDLAVADEAHRIAGVVSAKDKSERSQRVMLEEKEIKAVRRLFATATPRITGSKKTRDGDDILIESMDDESRFGKVAHSVTFQEAVKLKRLVPYKLVVTIVTKDEVDELIKNRQFIDVKGQTYPADEVATAIAIRRAYKDLGISKIISYHSRVAGARAFADLITQVPGRGKAPIAEHVAGSMPVNDRRHVLNRLAAATEPYLVTNARCLTEGIDVPALDAVAFADPRKSQVDIVQAVGRAMRQPMGKSAKTTGYIILPVYLTKKELNDPEAAVESSAFQPVLQVLRALKDHDPFMARFMAKILVAKGKKPHQKAGGITEILEVFTGNELDKELSRQLVNAVHLRTLEVSAGLFEHRFAVLEEYKTREGHCRVPQDWIEGGVRLGMWVSYLRDQGTYVSEEQRQRLTLIGFVWDARNALFDLNLEALKAFKERTGHTFVPPKWVEGDVRLGQWCNSIRTRKLNGTLNAEMIAALDSVGMSWDVLSEKFELKLLALADYVRREGNAKVPLRHKEAGFALGAWVNRLRQRREQLSPAQRARLDDLGMAWDPRNESFEFGLKALTSFHKREGHGRVPKDWVENGFPLRAWIASKRTNRESLSIDQQSELESLGMVWHTYEDAYSTNLEALKLFVDREGHAEVPVEWVEGPVRLGRWAAKLRSRNKSKLSASQIDDLNRLGFVWSPFDAQWEKYLTAFAAFCEREGHGLVPRDWKEGGENLGMWVHNLRRTVEDLRPDRREKLDSLGFIWQPRDWQFDRNLRLLQKYKERAGHIKVPAVWKEDGYGIGAWLSNVRRGAVKLTKSQRDKLRELGVELA